MSGPTVDPGQFRTVAPTGLAGVSHLSTPTEAEPYTPSAFAPPSVHDVPVWDDEDNFSPAAEQQEPPESGVCVWCGRYVANADIDYRSGGSHGACAAKSKRVDAGLRSHRQPYDGEFNVMTVRW